MTDYTTIERSIVILAPADAILPHLNDFEKWPAWSPWEGQDDALKRTYTGTQGRTGAGYAWEGNRKAGAGTMVLTSTTPASAAVDLEFTRPFKSTSEVTFTLHETPGAAPATKVVWSMRSPKTTTSKIMGLVINMDKMLGGDFEKGLAALKSTVEG